MIVATVLRTGLAAARGSVRIATGAVTHALWWINYRVGGLPRQAPDDPRRRRADED